MSRYLLATVFQAAAESGRGRRRENRIEDGFLFLAVPTSKGQALADEYGIKFFETSAKTNMNVEEVFFSIARDIKQRLAETDSKAEPQTIRISQPESTGASQATQRSACCGS